MKKHCRLLASLVLLIFVCAPANAYQSDSKDDESDFNETLLATEDENTFELTGGIGLAATGKNCFTDEHSGTSIFFGTSNYHHYFNEHFALGLDYTYLGSHSGKDLLRCHFVGPDILGRVLMDDGKQALTFSISPGYMHYADKTEKAKGHFVVFNKSYFAAKFSLGYQVALSKRFAFLLQTDLLTASWHENEDYTLLANHDDYYIDKYGHIQEDDSNNMFEPSLLFFSLSVGISYRF
jgi:hypothetical protein